MAPVLIWIGDDKKGSVSARELHGGKNKGELTMPHADRGEASER